MEERGSSGPPQIPPPPREEEQRMCPCERKPQNAVGPHRRAPRQSHTVQNFPAVSEHYLMSPPLQLFPRLLPEAVSWCHFSWVIDFFFFLALEILASDLLIIQRLHGGPFSHSVLVTWANHPQAC